MSEFAEVAQDFEADLAGFFRMKLDAEEMAALDCGGKLASVFAAGDSAIDERSAVGVGEVDEWRVGDSVKETRGRRDL
jgi:hypothetical protein